MRQMPEGAGIGIGAGAGLVLWGIMAGVVLLTSAWVLQVAAKALLFVAAFYALGCVLAEVKR